MEQKRVLMIDDEPSLRRLVEITLTRSGYVVATLAGVRNGKRLEGFAPGFDGELDLGLYSVAIIDGDLGEKSLKGWEIVPVLLQAGIICIAFSAIPESQAKLMQSGCWRKVEKTDVVNQLPAAVKDALELLKSA